MPWMINEIKNVKGMTLVEVMAALVLLALLAVTLLSVFSTTGSWINGAGKKTAAVRYAGNIIEIIRANSGDLDQISLPYRAEDGDAVDNDINDGTFNFKLDPLQEPFKASAARGMKAILTINRHNDMVYYREGDNNGDGIPEINGADVPFSPDLYAVRVKIGWTEAGHDREFEISTIMGAR